MNRKQKGSFQKPAKVKAGSDRKQMRKEMRKMKKARKSDFFQKKMQKSSNQDASEPPQELKEETPKTKKSSSQQTELDTGRKLGRALKKNEALDNPSPRNSLKRANKLHYDEKDPMALRDEEDIKYYSKLLGLGKGGKLEKRAKKEMVSEIGEDFLGLLDNIDKVVKKRKLEDYRPFEEETDTCVSARKKRRPNPLVDFDSAEENELSDNELLLEGDEEGQGSGRGEGEESDRGEGEESDQEEEAGEDHYEGEEENNEEEGGENDGEVEEENNDEEEVEEDEEEEIGEEEEIEEDELISEEEEIEGDEELGDEDFTEKKGKAAEKTDPKFLKKNEKVKPESDKQKSGSNATKSVLEKVNEEVINEIRKKILSGMNKLSEGNIDSILNQSVNKNCYVSANLKNMKLEVFNQNPKQIVSDILGDIFVSSTISSCQTVHHIISCSTALVAGLHQLFDNNFLAAILKKIVLKMRQTQAALKEQNAEKLETANRELKNTMLILCNLYIFDSVSSEFIKSLIGFFCRDFNSQSLEHLLMIIQFTGSKLRADSPRILKDVVVSVKEASEKYNSANNFQTKKQDFILQTLNDIKFNKKIKGDPIEKLNFLINWVKKNVLHRFKLSQKIFPMEFEAIYGSDFKNNRWWIPSDSYNFREASDSKTDDHLFGVSNQEQERLEQLAVKQKFVTDTRKKVFITIMSAEDYIDATQKLLKLKVNKKNLGDIATVITECCAQEENFNKYYAFLAKQLIQVNKGTRYAFQTSLWDHFKLLEKYSLRKICNIANFSIFLILERSIGLTILRNFNFKQLEEHQLLFLKIILKKLFSSDLLLLKQIFGKLKSNDEYIIFIEELAEFLKTYYANQLKQKLQEDPSDSATEDALRKLKLIAKHL